MLKKSFGRPMVPGQECPPVAVDRGHLPRFLDPVNISPDQEGFEVFLYGGVHGPKALRERGAPQPVEPIVRCDDFDDDQSGAHGLGEDGSDVLDGY